MRQDWVIYRRGLTCGSRCWLHSWESRGLLPELWTREHLFLIFVCSFHSAPDFCAVCTISLTDISISFMVSSMPEILSSTCYILLVNLLIPVQIPNFFIYQIPAVYVPFINSNSIFGFLISFFISLHCLCVSGFR